MSLSFDTIQVTIWMRERWGKREISESHFLCDDFSFYHCFLYKTTSFAIICATSPQIPFEAEGYNCKDSAWNTMYDNGSSRWLKDDRTSGLWRERGKQWSSSPRGTSDELPSLDFLGGGRKWGEIPEERQSVEWLSMRGATSDLVSTAKNRSTVLCSLSLSLSSFSRIDLVARREEKKESDFMEPGLNHLLHPHFTCLFFLWLDSFFPSVLTASMIPRETPLPLSLSFRHFLSFHSFLSWMFRWLMCDVMTLSFFLFPHNLFFSAVSSFMQLLLPKNQAHTLSLSLLFPIPSISSSLSYFKEVEWNLIRPLSSTFFSPFATSLSHFHLSLSLSLGFKISLPHLSTSFLKNVPSLTLLVALFLLFFRSCMSPFFPYLHSPPRPCINVDLYFSSWDQIRHSFIHSLTSLALPRSVWAALSQTSKIFVNPLNSINVLISDLSQLTIATSHTMTKEQLLGRSPQAPGSRMLHVGWIHLSASRNGTGRIHGRLRIVTVTSRCRHERQTRQRITSRTAPNKKQPAILGSYQTQIETRKQLLLVDRKQV